MLAAHDLSYTYRHGTSSVLQNWTAQFDRGTMTALTGPSGRGKSTLLYILGLMLRPTAGEILIDGQRVTGLADGALAHLRANRFGFVFQDAALDHTRTVIDNVTETALYRGVSRKAATNRGRELLDRFGVDVPPTRKPGQVSGGQAQRIALCRALLSEPAILLADEPTGNLDSASAAVIMDAFQDCAAGGSTVVIVTHSPEVANSCDHRLEL